MKIVNVHSSMINKYNNTNKQSKNNNLKLLTV